jgi:hypothetical protein
LYLNDDMFLASEHTVSDFWNPLTGLEIQVQPRLVVQAQDASVTDFQNDWNSEWTPLRYTNHVLSTPLTYPTFPDYRSTIRVPTTHICCPSRQSPISHHITRTSANIPLPIKRNLVPPLPRRGPRRQHNLPPHTLRHGTTPRNTP